MIRAQRYVEGSVVSGEGNPLSVSLAAPWVGVSKTVLVHFETLPDAGELLTISHQNRNGLASWKTELFSDDPNLCNSQDYSFLAPVSMQNGDSIIVEYPNSADVGITVSITLETA